MKTNIKIAILAIAIFSTAYFVYYIKSVKKQKAKIEREEKLVKTQELKLGEFQSVSLTGEMEVIFNKDSVNFIEMFETAKSNEFNVQEKEKSVSISCKRKNFEGIAGLAKLIIHYKALNSISSDGKISIDSEEALKADSLNLVFSGKTKIKNLVLDVNTLSCTLSDSSYVMISGNAPKASFYLHDNSVIYTNVVVEKCKIKALDKSFGAIGVSDSLQKQCSPSSDIKIFGNPKITEIKNVK